MTFGKYPRCTNCGYKVTQVLERVVKGKRIQLCGPCARKAGWYEEDKPEPKQEKLF